MKMVVIYGCAWILMQISLAISNALEKLGPSRDETLYVGVTAVFAIFACIYSFMTVEVTIRLFKQVFDKQEPKPSSSKIDDFITGRECFICTKPIVSGDWVAYPGKINKARDVFVHKDRACDNPFKILDEEERLQTITTPLDIERDRMIRRERKSTD